MTQNARIFWLVGAAVLAWVLYLLAPVLTPFIAAGLLAYLGDPLVDRLQKLRLPRSVAVLVVFILTFVIVGSLILLIMPLVRTEVAGLIEALPSYAQYIEEQLLPRIRRFLDGVGTGSGFGLGFGDLMSRYGEMAGEWGSNVIASLGRSGGAVVATLVSIFLVPVLTFYLLRDWDDIVARLARLVPDSRRDMVFNLVRQTDDVLAGFLRGQLLVMVGLAVVYTAGLLLIGLPFAVAIGVVSGLVSFVPYLGFILGILLAGLTALNEPNTLFMLIGVVVVFSVGQLIEGSFLTPRFVGNRIGLHPVLVIFAVMAFGQLFGFFGVLLALPAAAVLSVWARFAYAHYASTRPLPPELEKADDED